MPAAATFFAFFTILLWSFLAYLSSRLIHIPSFLLIGLALCIGGLVGIWQVRAWKVPVKTLAVGIAGLFGYHFLLFTAFKNAPVVEANLINYLWPLLIVLLSPLILSGTRLGWHHLLGGAVAFAGVALIVTGGSFHPDLGHLPGYLLAAAAALTWSCYSLLTKRLPPFPTGAVGAFCFAGGVLSLGIFALQGGTPAALGQLSSTDWILLILIGGGPLGTAFYTWDAALKRGDPRVIGSLAYLTPLASTLVLVLLGGKSLTWVSAAAVVLIVGGAVLGSRELFASRGRDRDILGTGSASQG
ncbi:MAG TPA: DMT family transporter [Anaerolineaceae bacterium]